MESRQDMLDLQMAAAESLVSCLTSGKSYQTGPASCFKIYVIQSDSIECLMSQLHADVMHNFIIF